LKLYRFDLDGINVKERSKVRLNRFYQNIHIFSFLNLSIIMKIIITIILFLVLHLSFKAQRHGVSVGLGTEVTVGGAFGNVHVGVELNRHHIGFTHGQKMRYSDNEFNPANKYFGGYYQFTFYREQHLQLGGMFRAGFVDDHFFTYIPSLMVDYVFNDYFKLNLGVGVRGQKPSTALTLSYNIPFKKK